MSGKGKRKGKGNSKPEERDAKLDKKRIDVVCLAYDIFKHSASKFGVDANCIAAWDGPKNDYGDPPLHFIYIHRAVLLSQMKFRFMWYDWFKRFGKIDQMHKIESFEPVAQLLEKLIAYITNSPIPTKLNLVEVTLALTCELMLCLHAKGEGLYLKQLAERWFEFYFRTVKKKFEREGGFDAVCMRGYLHVRECPHAFIDLCITCYKYTDYAAFVKDERLIIRFMETVIKHMRKNKIYDCPKPPFVHPPTVDKIIFLPVPTAPAPGGGLTPNPALGVPLPQEMYDFTLTGDQAPSKSLPGASVKEPTKKAKKPSHRERKNLKSNSRLGVDQGHPSSDSSTVAVGEPPLTYAEDSDEDSGANLLLNPGLGISPPSALYGSDLTGAAPLSQNLPEESVQEPSKRPKRASYLERIRTRRASSRSTVEQGHGQFSSTSSMATGPSQPQRQGSRPKIQVPTIGSSGLQTGESSLYLSLEQRLAKLNLDSSGTRLHRMKEPIPSIAKYLTQSSPGEIRQEPTKEDPGSSSEEEV